MQIRHNSENQEANSRQSQDSTPGKIIPFPKRLPVSSSKIKLLFQTVFQGENKKKS